MKNFTVNMTDIAEQDISAIYQYIERSDGQQQAEKVFDKLEEKILSLNQNPQRGNFPPEMLEIGINNFREVHVYSYRIIYNIDNYIVDIIAIADGRRDMGTFLEERLFQRY